MLDFGLSSSVNVHVELVGELQTPVLVVDNFATKPRDLQQYAIGAGQFSTHGQDYYPGERCLAPKQYQQNLIELIRPVLLAHYANIDSQQDPKLTALSELNCLLSAFSITTTPVEKLKPIQMLPHFDNVSDKQFAVVHYLANGDLNSPTSKPGGTAFYRHISTGLERIRQAELATYAQVLKQQAMQANLHKTPGYISALPKKSPQWQLFEQVGKVEHKYNRAVIYPANLLHSGVINLQLLDPNPTKGRLTLNSFLCFS